MSLYTSTPIGGLSSERPENEWQAYVDKAMAQPKPISDLIFSPKTGAYIRGVAKEYGVLEDKEGKLAFLLFRVLIGEVPRSSMASLIASDLAIEQSIAGNIAKDIEHDLLSTASSSLGQSTVSDKKMTTSSRQAQDLKNVLNLKEQPKKTPRPPSLPPQPPAPQSPQSQ